MLQSDSAIAAQYDGKRGIRIRRELALVVLDGLVPLLPGLVQKLLAGGDRGEHADTRFAVPTSRGILERLLRIDAVYLAVLIASGVIWSLSPIPSGLPIVGGIVDHLRSAPVAGLLEGIGLGLGLLVLVWRLVAFVGVAAWIIMPGSAASGLAFLPPAGPRRPSRATREPAKAVPNAAPGSPAAYHLAAIAVYGVLESYFAVTTKIGTHLATGLISERSADPVLFLWYLGWWPFAFAHHLNPFHTSLVWAPGGYDLAWSTPIPSLSVLALPLTNASNPMVSYNALTILAAPLAAYAAFLLANELGITRWFAVAAGLMYGFSPYVFAQERGHLNLIIAFVPPLVGVIWLRYRRDRLGRRPAIALLAVMLAFQFGVANEIYTTTCIFFALLLAADYGWHRNGPRRMRRHELATAFWAVLWSAVLVSPYLFEMALHFHSRAVNSAANFANDVYGIVLPDPLSPFGPNLQALTGSLLAKGSELDGYISLPLLALFAYFALRAFRSENSSRLLRMLAVFGVASLAISLGPDLQVRGQYWLPSFSLAGSHNMAIMPWALPAKLPILANVLPDRISMYTALFFALTIMRGLQELLARRPADAGGGRIRPAHAALALVAGLGILAELPWAQRSTLGFPIDHSVVPALFSSPELAHCLPPSSVALFLPFAGSGYAMGDQLAAHYSFAVAGGYLGGAPAWAQAQPLYAHLLAYEPLPSQLRSQLPGLLGRLGINTVVVPTGVGAPWTSYISALGPTFPEVCSSGGVIVYRHS
ncbi:MAG: hypothetical protein M0Z47_00815 [Actinomycetota bacterium]|nr:hypothetical protein [Actinomycetota bacterium]